jgi:GNAT superfamily N-acetyltransferase
MKSDDINAPSPITRELHYKSFFPSGDICGQAVLVFRGGELWISNVWVDSKARGQGLATRLLERAIKEHEQRDIYLQVGPFDGMVMSEPELSTFYAEFGFRPVAAAPSIMKRLKAQYKGRSKNLTNG